VRVYAPAPVQPGCRCSRERVVSVLRTLKRGELDDLREDGAVQVTCEFCSTRYAFDDAALDEVYGAF
jgi:molecular chaperone Hsp33